MNKRAKKYIWFAVACLIILFATVSSNISTTRFVDHTEWMVHSAQVRSETERVNTLLITAQNNIRAYHIAEQSHFLTSYHEAKTQIYQALAQLRQSTADNPKQALLIGKATELINQKIASWDGSFELRRREGWKAIVALLQSDQNKHQDKDLYDSVNNIKIEEETLFRQRVDQSISQGYWAKFISWASGLIACLLIGFASFFVYRESRLREVAESNVERYFKLSLDLLCISGMDGYFKKLSPSFHEVLGYSLEELYSRPVVDFVHPDDIQKTVDEIARQGRGHKVLSFENRFRCKNGGYRIFSWKSVPEGDFMYAVARDITRQKEFEGELIAARETAQKATEAKTAFLATMSHEIRTPLNGVVGMADLLSRTTLSSQQKTFVSTIQSSASILMRTINEILDFSKIEARKMLLEKIDFDLEQLIQSKISLVGPLAHSKDLKLNVIMDPRIPRILRGDANKIGQVLLNLLNNSIKFTPQGHITVETLATSLDSSHCKLKIQVRDTGIGMPADQTLHLFEPYSQADSSTSRKYGGTGLGLSICKNFVEFMGGTVGIESEPGKGSTFWFTLPLEVSQLNKVIALSTDISAEIKIPSAATAENRKKIRVLVAEDNSANQMIIMEMMRILGYSTTLAVNGEEALKLHQENKFDIILMDQHMPVMDGMESAEAIRKNEKESNLHTPIIAFTATVVQNDEKSSFEKLMDDSILKPVTVDNLEKVLSKWESRINST